MARMDDDEYSSRSGRGLFSVILLIGVLSFLPWLVWADGQEIGRYPMPEDPVIWVQQTWPYYVNWTLFAALILSTLASFVMLRRGRGRKIFLIPAVLLGLSQMSLVGLAVFNGAGGDSGARSVMTEKDYFQWKAFQAERIIRGDHN